MRELGDTLGVEMHVYGPEMHVTGIVPLALQNSKKGLDTVVESHDSGLDPSPRSNSPASVQTSVPKAKMETKPAGVTFKDMYVPFTPQSQSFIYGMQPRAVQGMLDYDFMCKRATPSVACMIYPFGGHHVQKFYWGTAEILLPIYTSVKEACERFPDVAICVNFASSRRYNLLI
jgi:ATP citrate (pro-S)-lyase